MKMAHHSMWPPLSKKITGHNSEVKVNMGGSGNPAETNIVAAHGLHGPDGARTAGGKTVSHFDLQCETPIGNPWAHESHGPIWPKPAAGGQTAEKVKSL